MSRCLARQLLYNFSWEGIFVSLEENFDCIEREKGGKEIKGNKKKERKGRRVKRSRDPLVSRAFLPAASFSRGETETNSEPSRVGKR